MPEWVSELTEAQQAVLEPPYIYHRPLIEADGTTGGVSETSSRGGMSSFDDSHNRPLPFGGRQR